MSRAQRDRRFQEVVQWIEEQVRAGTMQPGDRLPPERKLVGQFGISRTAVREALQALAARGLTESHVGRGTFIRLPDTSHLASKFELLTGDDTASTAEALEAVVGVMMWFAAERSSSSDHATLAALATRADEDPDGVDAFLGELGDAAKNPLLGIIARALATMLQQKMGADLPVNFVAVAERVAVLQAKRGL